MPHNLEGFSPALRANLVPASQARYTSREEPLSKRVALHRRNDELNHLQARVDELTDSIKELSDKPLPATEAIHVLLYPGDEGYEEVGFPFRESHYSGHTRWVNVPTATDNLDNVTNPAYTDGSINQEHE